MSAVGVRKHARHRRKAADVSIDDAEQSDDSGLVGGDAVEVAHLKKFKLGQQPAGVAVAGIIYKALVDDC
jgi:hypothetical protein